MIQEHLSSLEGGGTMPHRGIVLPPLVLFFGSGNGSISALLVLPHQINHHLFPELLLVQCLPLVCHLVFSSMVDD